MAGSARPEGGDRTATHGGPVPRLASSIACLLVALVLAAAFAASGAHAAPAPIRSGSAARSATGATDAEDERAPAAPVAGRTPTYARPAAAPPSDRPSPPETDEGPATTFGPPYQIARSGRPSGSTSSAFAYDGDPRTAWATAGPAKRSYAWFDLGTARPIVAVRWLRSATGGAVDLQISNDRETWATVGRDAVDATGAWRTARVGRTARYVRLVFAGAGGVEPLGQLAEIEILGPPDAEPDAVAPRLTAVRTASDGADRADRDDAANRGDRVAANGRNDPADRSRRPSTAAARPDRAAPAPSAAQEVPAAEQQDDRDRNGVHVEGDCSEGVEGVECRVVVDIHADGGTATCDESGGDGNRGANAGNGGTCTEDASAGTVTVGDITCGQGSCDVEGATSGQSRRQRHESR